MFGLTYKTVSENPHPWLWLRNFIHTPGHLYPKTLTRSYAISDCRSGPRFPTNRTLFRPFLRTTSVVIGRSSWRQRALRKNPYLEPPRSLRLRKSRRFSLSRTLSLSSRLRTYDRQISKKTCAHCLPWTFPRRALATVMLPKFHRRSDGNEWLLLRG